MTDLIVLAVMLLLAVIVFVILWFLLGRKEDAEAGVSIGQDNETVQDHWEAAGSAKNCWTCKHKPVSGKKRPCVSCLRCPMWKL